MIRHGSKTSRRQSAAGPITFHPCLGFAIHELGGVLQRSRIKLNLGTAVSRIDIISNYRGHNMGGGPLESTLVVCVCPFAQVEIYSRAQPSRKWVMPIVLCTFPERKTAVCMNGENPPSPGSRILRTSETEGLFLGSLFQHFFVRVHILGVNCP